MYATAPIFCATAWPCCVDGRKIGDAASLDPGKLSARYLLGRDGHLVHLPELLDRPRVLAQILLAADKDHGQPGAEVQDLRDPLSRGHNFGIFARLVPDRSRALAFSWTFSRLSGESIEKVIRMTCESGYESGRNRS